MKFVINEIPRTKKNSQQIVMVNGRSMIIPSKAYKEYEKACGKYMPTIDKPISYTCNIAAEFYMPTHRRVDLMNLQEALHDILVHYGILEDDNVRIVFSTDGSAAFYDKEHPRTVVTITPIEIDEEGLEWLI